MGVELLELATVEPYRLGYEQCVGTARVALDPAHPANRAIVDLERAGRDADGKVRFETDVVLLRAPDPGGLLVVVANRGMVTTLPYGSGAPPGPATGFIDPGDEWVLRRGLSVLWVGWQWDVDRRPGAVGLEAPEALDDLGRPLRGQARLGFQPLADTPRRRLADEVLPHMGQFRALPVADLADPAAVLTARQWFNGPRQEVARERWRFADHEHVELDGGFVARVHYELTYTTSRCPVTGAGMAALRDVAVHLRGDHTHTLGSGVSQSGRWLRQFLFDTGNVDEDGRRVLDGIHVHLAGGRRGEFNHRYAQPSTMNPLGFTHLPPFSPADGLADRTRAAGTEPKVVSTNSATEYWRGDASLGHPGPGDAQWRSYLYAGSHHAGQVPGLVASLPVQLPGNLVDITWPTRAHLVVLEDWVRDGLEPPPTAVPTAADGTAASREEVLAALPHLPGLVKPAPEALLGLPPLDLGPHAQRGVGRFPPIVTGPARSAVVSAVDADGNEIAGVRLPHVAVPLDVSFGWNPELPRPGVPVEVWNLVGGRVPLGAEQVRRRYGSREAFLDRVRSVADELVRVRHLLAGDVEAVMADAARRWDEAVAEP